MKLVMVVIVVIPTFIFSNNRRFYFSNLENWPEEHWKQQPDKPAFWTENTEILGYELWGFATVQRPPEDVAWVVSRFIQVGG